MNAVPPGLRDDGFAVRPTTFIGPPALPLPADVTPEGFAITRWKLTDEDRAAVAHGADLWLAIATYGQPLQPISLGFQRKDVTGE